MNKTRNCGTGLLFVAAVAGLLAGCGQQKPRIEADAKDNTVTVFSTSSKADRCDVRVMFSYMQDSARKTAAHFCNRCGVLVGTHVKMSDVTDAIIVDPRIESVEAVCDSEHAGKPSWIK